MATIIMISNNVKAAVLWVIPRVMLSDTSVNGISCPRRCLDHFPSQHLCDGVFA